MSLLTPVPAGGDVQRSGPIRRSLPPRDNNLARAHPPAEPTATVQRPRLMSLVLALSAVLVSLFVYRNVAQATAIYSSLTESGSLLSEAAGMTAESAGWIVDTSFVVVVAWVAIALYAFSGSTIGRAVFTALLAAGASLGTWSALAPQSAALGRGELILASAHPGRTSLTSLGVAIVCIVLIVLLYRPDANEYFRAHSRAHTSQPRDRGHLEARVPDLSEGEPAAVTIRAPGVPGTPAARDARVT